MKNIALALIVISSIVTSACATQSSASRFGYKDVKLSALDRHKIDMAKYKADNEEYRLKERAHIQSLIDGIDEQIAAGTAGEGEKRMRRMFADMMEKDLVGLPQRAPDGFKIGNEGRYDRARAGLSNCLNLGVC